MLTDCVGADSGAVGLTVSAAISGELGTVGGGQGDVTFGTGAEAGGRRGKGEVLDGGGMGSDAGQE